MNDIIVNTGELKKNKRPGTYKKSKPSKKSSAHGYKFESEVLKSLEKLKVNHPNLYYYKMVDTHSYDWLKSVLRELKGIVEELDNFTYVRKKFHDELSRIMEILEVLQKFIVPKVPADIIVFYNGNGVVIECKSSQRAGGFVPFPPYVSEHQLEASEQIELAGIPYLFFICDRTVQRQHKLSIFTTERFNDMRDWCDTQTRRTTPWKRVKEFSSSTLEKQKGQTFDLEWLIKYLEQHKA